MKRSKSTLQGWKKDGAEYVHERGTRVKKTGQLWEIVGGKNDGDALPVLWSALYHAEKTPAHFV